MCGLYLAAAELSRRGFAVSPTLRGNGLLVMDADSTTSLVVSVAAKTGREASWRLEPCRHGRRAIPCVHVFVDIGTAGDGELFAVPGARIAALAASPGCGDGRVRRAALRRYGGKNARRAFAAQS